jgi:GT2 family glycosyltransferase
MRRTSAIVVNFNGAKLTQACIASLLLQTAELDRILVVDNGSSLADWKILQETMPVERITLIRSERNLGYAGGINLGLSSLKDTSQDFVLVSNNDLILGDNQIVQKLIDTLADNPGYAAASPLIRDKDCPVPIELSNQVRRLPSVSALLIAHSCWLRRMPLFRSVVDAYGYVDLRPWPLGVTLPCETVNGACFLLGRDFLTSVQLLDEHTFLYMEEHILGCQLRSIGKCGCLVTSAIADHIQGASTKQRLGAWRLRMLIHQVRSELYFARIYLNAGLASRLLLLAVRTTDIIIKGAVRILRIDT